MKLKNIIILGIGNVLFSDEGFGIRAIEFLKCYYNFSNNVLLVDGGVLGINLMGIISKADNLIVLDAIKNGGVPGTIYKINGGDIPDRIRTKNSLHQIDFLEAFTLTQALGKIPKTIILGIEPKDIQTLKPKLTKIIFEKLNEIIFKTLKELDKLNVDYNMKRCSEIFKPYWQ